MGLFDRFRSQPWSLEGLDAPWGDRPSIYEHVRARLAAGEPLGDLPDEALVAEQSGGLHYAPGARDGILGHHGSGGQEARGHQIAEALLDLAGKSTDGRLDFLYQLVLRAPLVSAVDAIIEAVEGAKGSDPAHLEAIGVYLATRAADREAVKLGMSVLGALEGRPHQHLFMTLGRHEELTLYAAVGLINALEAPEAPLFELARQVKGWGRIQLVERLADTTDPEVRAWLLREGWDNEAMVEYTAHTCATAGGLVVALQDPEIDDVLLRSGGALLAALAAGGPAAGMDDYEDGPAALAAWLGHLERRPGTSLEHLPRLQALSRWLALEEGGPGDGWEAIRGSLRDACVRVLGLPAWPPLVEAALASEDEAAQRVGGAAARAIGIAVVGRHLAQLKQEPLHADAWARLFEECEEAQIGDVVAAAEALLPLATLSTGPTDDLGLGPGYDAHHALDAVLEGLQGFPGRGARLIATGLRSPVVRNRSMALQALAGWEIEEWDPSFKALLSEAAEAEPNPELRERLEEAALEQ